MGLFTWILVGLVAGFIAEQVVGGGGGIARMTLVGVAGAIVGGYLGVKLGFGTVTGFNIRSLVIAVFGAILVIVAVRAVSGRGHGGLI